MSDYLVSVSKNYYPSKEENVVKSIFLQYETVIIYSLITSFGLDFLIKDQHGGDVDTIHNVRQIGKDLEMKNLKMTLPETQEISSITSIYPCAFIYENEMHDLFGVQIKMINIDFEGKLYRTAIETPFK